MTTAAPPRPHVHLQDEGEPRSRFYQIAHRISDRFEPEVAAAFLEAIEDVRDQVDLTDVARAIRSGDVEAVATALRLETLRATLAERQALAEAFRNVFAATSEASTALLEEALGVTFDFATRDPAAILFARSQSSTLITRITADQRLAVQAIMGRAFSEGIPTARQARLIHQIVGIRHDHVQAPLNLADELRGAGRAAEWSEARRIEAATSRRLDAATKQRIRSRIRAGTVTEEFIDEVTETYTHSLRRRRATDIARTETIRSSSAGQDDNWRTAQQRGILPQTARRLAIVTPDDRLRPSHAVIPSLNPEGVPIGEPFVMPDGSHSMYPPWDFDPYSCRCGVGLLPNPSEGGVI